ncbi:MAG: glycosyltransferase family 39 protein, partial [Chloroflexota bacterium]|nr:glycosyltransferase family 39 protein [Chloroflexota bacterium]
MADLALPRPRPLGWTRLAVPLELATLTLLLAFAARLRWLRLDTYTGSFDEGIRSQQLLLMSAGYRPFRDIFSSQGPLLLDLLYPSFVLFGQNLQAARAGVAIFSMIGLVGAWLTARAIAGPVAGTAAVGILLLSPGYLEGSRLALAEVPTIAPALLAIAALLAYRHGGDRRWLVASAGLCALALLIKPMVIHVGAPLLVLLVFCGGRRAYYHALIDLALYGAVVGLLCAATVLALGPGEVWENLGAYRAGAGHGVGSDAVMNLRLTANVIAHERIGFLALAAGGLVLGLWRRPVETAAVGLWGLAVLGFFALYGDLADKHIVYLVPPLALLGAIGVGLTIALVR